MALITDALFAADSSQIDWKPLSKIACLLEVLVLKSADACSTTTSLFQTSAAIVFSSSPHLVLVWRCRKAVEKLDGDTIC